MKVLLLGATGYTGSLLLKLLLKHPNVDTISAVSTSIPGLPIPHILTLGHSLTKKMTSTNYIDITSINKDYDVIFAALPHGISASMYQSIILKYNAQYQNSSNKSITLPQQHPLNTTNSSSEPEDTKPVWIDLSADFRFNDVESYVQAYGESSLPEKRVAYARAMNQSVYGLSELLRNKISHATIIACPGCYPTSILLPLIPILRHCTPTHTITISSISGISGAGSNPRPELLYGERVESLKPYSPGRMHRHFYEMKQQLQAISYSEAMFTFSPHLAPLKQGMLSTIHIPLKSYDIGRAIESLNAQYIDEPFVSISEDLSLVDTQYVRNTNKIHISFKQEDDMLILFSAIDNLWKGASGQAIQNFNIRFGYKEDAGLGYFAT